VPRSIKRVDRDSLKHMGLFWDLTGIIFCMQDAGKGEPVCSPCYVGQTRRSAPAKGGVKNSLFLVEVRNVTQSFNYPFFAQSDEDIKHTRSG